MKKAPTVREILEDVVTLSGHALYEDEGVRAGDAERSVKRAVVCWMATPAAVREAEERRADLVLAHEGVFFSGPLPPRTGEGEPWEQWLTNRRRKEAIDRSGATVARVHGSADEICIFDEFARLLGLGRAGDREESDREEGISRKGRKASPPLPEQLRRVNSGRKGGEGVQAYHKVYDVEPTTLAQLLARVKRAVGFAHVRVSCRDGDLDREFRRVGLPWGGLGLDSNVSYQAWAIEQGCDVLIAGESDSYGFRFSAECDVPMIETSHEASEIPGLRKFLAILAERHPEAEFSFYDNGLAWRWM
ncbi:MAG: Nif3-like dinuclear metal center hexameric protein [Planctomycetota bacterium]